MTSRHRAQALGVWPAVVAVVLAITGCGQSGSSLLIVATDLPEAECARLAASFSGWAGGRAELAGVRPRIVWLRAIPGDEPARLLERRVALDVVLGGSASTFRRLEAAGQLGAIEHTSPAWMILRHTELGIAADAAGLAAVGKPVPVGWSDLAAPAFANQAALDDPRRDPLTLALALGELADDRWAQRYADLVRGFASARQIGARRGTALAALERGAAAVAPADPRALAPREGFAFVPWTSALDPGVGLAPAAPNPQLARMFFQFLGEAGLAALPREFERSARGSDVLAADLLGAGLVDAHAELVTAVQALARAGRPDLAAKWLTPPPWPPASVRKLYQKDPTGSLAEALAGQLAPDLDNRVWLLESWNAPERPIDGRLLDALAAAVDGKLLAEPRFRAWLRAEWAAWARQNYRRIVRQLTKGSA